MIKVFAPLAAAALLVGLSAPASAAIMMLTVDHDVVEVGHYGGAGSIQIPAVTVGTSVVVTMIYDTDLLYRYNSAGVEYLGPGVGTVGIVDQFMEIDGTRINLFGPGAEMGVQWDNYDVAAPVFRFYANLTEGYDRIIYAAIPDPFAPGLYDTNSFTEEFSTPWTSSTNNAAVVFTDTALEGGGKSYLKFGGGTVTVTNTTPTPVPEPATWAMMIVGFALVGGALRRRSPAVAIA